MRKLISHTTILLFIGFAGVAQAQEKPDILVLWGEDIGWSTISAYSLALTGYETPNIDRIASEVALFTHGDAQQSSDVPKMTNRGQ